MDQQYAPVQSPVGPVFDMVDSNRIFMAFYTCTSAFLLFVTFVTVLTRFRLWHNNKFLKKIPELANSPVISLINQGIAFVTAYLYPNTHDDDVYLIWVVILLISYEIVFTISSCSLLEQASERRAREYVFLNNCILTGYLIFKYQGNRNFNHLLWSLWFMVVFKFLIRLKSYVLAERAYGLKNANLVADYMKSEHKLTQFNDATDPINMQGYKYLVMGEEKVEPKTEAPDYITEVELTAHVVTVEKVWSCKERLLHPFVDTKGSLKDVCLSFSLFKLLRRRYFGYPAAEAQQPKTRKLVFNGLLSTKATGKDEGEVDKERVFRVIKMEIGFLRDFFHTRYPLGFANGFPFLSLVITGGMLGVILFIAIKAFQLHKEFETNHNHYEKIDYHITNVLLILLVVMVFFEALTYAFCDWTKVIMVCQNVRTNCKQVASELASSEASQQKTHRLLLGWKVL